MSGLSAHPNRTMRAGMYAAAVLTVIGLSACATAPMSPSLVTLPGTGRSFDQFRADDYNCRLYGEVQIGLRPAQSAAAAAMTVGTNPGAPGATTSTAFIGGGQGGAIGQAVTPPGVIPSSNLPAGTAYAAQQRYDNAYIQCMYASGNRVPVNDSGPRPAAVATQPSNIPQPPPGAPPAPPSGIAKPASSGSPGASAISPAPAKAPPLPPPGPAPAPPPSVRTN
jgi:hypothetical protein